MSSSHLPTESQRVDYAEVSMIATTSTSENERSRTSAIFDLDSDEESEVLKLFAECEISQFCISDSDILESFAIQTTQSDIAVSTVVGDEGASRMLAASVAPEGYRGPSVAMCSKRPGGSCKRSVPIELTKDAAALRTEAEPPSKPVLHDGRSPMQRFRTSPQKPLSVTDLISPAWCELQYWFSLTKHGKKRQTVAMRQGSDVHRVLQEQVHEFVPIQVLTKEDSWGLRLWNIIQGLKTLRANGLTRELEVWGFLDGELVHGVIDQLAYDNPVASTTPKEENVSSIDVVPPQTGIGSGALSNEGGHLDGYVDSNTWAGSMKKVISITDIKTRRSTTLPGAASLTPTLMQLMIYRRLLCQMVNDEVDENILFKRYRLKSDNPFSNTFIKQFDELGQSGSGIPQQNPNGEDQQAEKGWTLSKGQTLSSLWRELMKELKKTIPSINIISEQLHAEFRTQLDSEFLGVKSFVYDDTLLSKYISEKMDWWKGNRAARGVDIEEAFKCRICEFADSCDWKMSKMNASTNHYRRR